MTKQDQLRSKSQQRVIAPLLIQAARRNSRRDAGHSMERTNEERELDAVGLDGRRLRHPVQEWTEVKRINERAAAVNQKEIIAL
jgi:hypothetical protein